MNLNISEIEFEERYDNEEYGTTTLYFIAPKEILGDKYPEAEHATISIEFDFTSMNPRDPSVMVSPTKDGLDYNWQDVNHLDPDILEKLIHMGL